MTEEIKALRGVSRVTAGPYTLELPANGVAVLHQADGGGSDYQLPGGIGYLDALVQFAGEVIRLNAMLEQIEKRAESQEIETYDLQRMLRQMVDAFNRAIMGVIHGEREYDACREAEEYLGLVRKK